MPLKIVRNDITKMNTEAIVNTANDHPTVGSGCDSAIYKAAGYEELLRFRTEQIGFVPEGEAFISPGFHLQAKYIIHAVSPRYQDGNQGEEEKLRSCYRKSLQLAKEHGIASIAFPLIATGSFGYPKEEGLRIAVDEMHSFLLSNAMEIYLVVFDEKMTQLGERIYPDLEAYIDQRYVAQISEVEYDTSFHNVSRSNLASPRAYTGYEPGSAFGGSPAEMDPQRISADVSRPRMSAEMAQPSMAQAHTPVPAQKSSRLGSIFKKKTTSSAVLFSFEEQHESKLAERMKHMSDTYSEYLLYLIQEKHLENAEVWKRAIVDKKVFSKIKNNVNYHPNKLTALCLCIGAKLNLDETKDLLARAGYALSPCDKTDIIFSYFIENEIYDMIELDIQLEEHGLPCIIS